MDLLQSINGLELERGYYSDCTNSYIIHFKASELALKEVLKLSNLANAVVSIYLVNGDTDFMYWLKLDYACAEILVYEANKRLCKRS